MADQEMTVDNLKEIAKQLAKPDGEKGVDIGRAMYESNITMTRNTIRHLELQDDETVLELAAPDDEWYSVSSSCSSR